jgi:3-oxoacyl-[acyl-carrier protein] reductase
MSASLLGLEGTTALVTGAGQGLGEGIAELFAIAGANVAVVDVDGTNADAVAQRLGTMGVTAAAYEADVRDTSGIDAVVDAAVARFGRIDTLVNNAGGLAGHRAMPSLDATAEFWDDIVDLNLRSTFFWSQAVARHMVANEVRGCIVNISAINALRAAVGIAPYGAAKAGVIQLTRTLALELGAHGIRVNCVAPGRTETPALTRLVTPEKQQATAANTPLRRLASTRDVAGVVVALASSLFGYITAQTISADGGLTSTMARPPI